MIAAKVKKGFLLQSKDFQVQITNLLLAGEAKWKVPGDGDRGGGEAGAGQHQHQHHHHRQHHRHIYHIRIPQMDNHQASLGSQYVLSAPPLKSTKKLVREFKRILTGKGEH